MLTLAIDSSAKTASAAIMRDGEITASKLINAGLTHSETLLLLVDDVLKQCSLKNEDIDRYALSVGPGSFTGVRIGAALIKGLAFAGNKPCAGVSTLEAAAYNFLGENALICVVMDARRNQFYNALFSVKGSSVERIRADRAILYSDLLSELKSYNNEKIIIAGDGAELFSTLGELPQNAQIASEDKVFQSASGVALCSEKCKFISSADVNPVYLRPSQAERELKLKKEG